MIKLSLTLLNDYERANLCVMYIVHLSTLKLHYIERVVIGFANIYLCIQFDQQSLTDIIMYCMSLAVSVSPKKEIKSKKHLILITCRLHVYISIFLLYPKTQGKYITSRNTEESVNTS